MGYLCLGDGYRHGKQNVQMFHVAVVRFFLLMLQGFWFLFRLYTLLCEISSYNRATTVLWQTLFLQVLWVLFGFTSLITVAFLLSPFGFYLFFDLWVVSGLIACRGWVKVSCTSSIGRSSVCVFRQVSSARWGFLSYANAFFKFCFAAFTKLSSFLHWIVRIAWMTQYA